MCARVAENEGIHSAKKTTELTETAMVRAMENCELGLAAPGSREPFTTFTGRIQFKLRVPTGFSATILVPLGPNAISITGVKPSMY